MQGKKIRIWANIFFAVLVLSCNKTEEKPFYAEEDKLNGTWISNRDYNAIIEGVRTVPGYKLRFKTNEYGWGEGKYTFPSVHIDISEGHHDFISDSGGFSINKMKRSGPGEFEMEIRRPEYSSEMDRSAYIRILFLDEDTILLYQEGLNDPELNPDFDPAAPWHRLSGPSGKDYPAEWIEKSLGPVGK